MLNIFPREDYYKMATRAVLQRGLVGPSHIGFRSLLLLQCHLLCEITVSKYTG